MAYGQALLIDWAIPIAKPVTPCEPKRPMGTGLGIERPSAHSGELERTMGKGGSLGKAIKVKKL
jgi:hypothetical protein